MSAYLSRSVRFECAIRLLLRTQRQQRPAPGQNNSYLLISTIRRDTRPQRQMPAIVGRQCEIGLDRTHYQLHLRTVTDQLHNRHCLTSLNYRPPTALLQRHSHSQSPTFDPLLPSSLQLIMKALILVGGYGTRLPVPSPSPSPSPSSPSPTCPSPSTRSKPSSASASRRSYSQSTSSHKRCSTSASVQRASTTYP